MFFRAFRMDSTRAGDSCACIVIESHTTPKYVVLWAGERPLFLALSLKPRDSRWARTSGTSCVVAIFLRENMRPWDRLSQTNPLIRSETQSSWLSTFWTCKIWGSGSIREDLKLDATPHLSWEPENTGCNSLTLCLAGEHVLWPLCPAELATPVSTNAFVPVSRKWRPRR